MYGGARVGNGQKVRVWGDPWLPAVDNPYVITPKPAYLNCPAYCSLCSALCQTHGIGSFSGIFFANGI